MNKSKISDFDGVSAMPHGKWFTYSDCGPVGWSKAIFLIRARKLVAKGVLKKRMMPRAKGGRYSEYFFTKQIKRSELARLKAPGSQSDELLKDKLFNLFMRA